MGLDIVGDNKQIVKKYYSSIARARGVETTTKTT